MTTLDHPLPEPVDLTNCDQEPIRIPGLIQPHGALLTLRPDLTIVQASVNGERLLGRPAATLHGQPLDALLPPTAVAQVRGCLDRAPAGAGALFACTATVNGAALECIVHRADGGVVVELEPALPREQIVTAADAFGVLREAVAHLQQAPTVAAFCQTAARQVRALTGFDRVMVYQFMPDGHGVVVAEALADGLTPYLGLHYPASDIPVQARALYVQNWLRLIPDAAYTAVPLDPAWNPLTAAPLDMTHSVLRSVSPVHLEYLANMGVRASMSISLVREGALWGLIACHHEAGPRYLPYDLRAACEFLGQTFSLLLTEKERADSNAQRLHMQDVQARLTTFMAHEPNLTDALTQHLPTVWEFVACGGAAVVAADGCALLGETPPREAVQALAGWLAGQFPGEVVALDDLPARYPAAATLGAGAVGVLALALAPGRPEYVLWFRPEVARTVSWAGDPAKPVTVGPLGARLTPRQSFALWQETVRGQSAPWTAVEIAGARELRTAILSVAIEQVARLARLNAELAQSNSELDAFAYVASHDLKEPLRGIHFYVQFLQEDYGDQLDAEGRERLATLTRLTRRMDDLIESLLLYSRIGREEPSYAPVKLDDALRSQLDLLGPSIEQARALVQVAGPLPVVRGDAMRLGEVFANLISNALKYNEAATPTVTISATTGRATDGAPLATITVRDNGIGIATEQQEAIFRIFRRLHARDAYGGGAGAGLTIARRIVERHGGRLWVESSPGAGSAFHFTLPLATDAEETI